MKFILFSEYGELLDLGMHLKDKGHIVEFFTPSHEHAKIGEGILERAKHWYLRMGQGFIWVFDGCENGKLQDWLRSKGELVVGGCEKGDRLENERQLNQDWFKRAGFYQPFSQNFKDIEEAINFAQEWFKKGKGRLILKQNGDAPKSINHMGKFEDGSDMIYHLNNLKKSWSETQFGKFDCDLMEVVEGMEVAASAFFNGKNFLKNKQGKVTGFLNWEEKKEANGNTGETTGEMGTTFAGVTENNNLFRDIILKPEIINVLRKIGFKGVFDINCIQTKKGIVALEPTMRPGVPATSYEFMEGMITPIEKVLEYMAKGYDNPIEVYQGIGMVMVIAAKPYPLEGEVDEESTSLGEKLWIMQNEKPIKELTSDQNKHIHLENFYKDDEGNYKVATKNGYLLTVTSKGKTVKEVRDNLIKYIKENIYISGMKYRTDIGERVEKLGL